MCDLLGMADATCFGCLNDAAFGRMAFDEAYERAENETRMQECVLQSRLFRLVRATFACGMQSSCPVCALLGVVNLRVVHGIAVDTHR